MEKILIVEDDGYISNLLKELLGAYEVTQAFSGTEALRLCQDRFFDLIVLDLMLPGLSGEEIIKQKAQDVPILVVSAKKDAESRLNALRLGADDVLIKPFLNEEVVLKVKALLRRHKTQKHDRIDYEELRLNKHTMEVQVKDRPVKMTHYEFQILQCLMENPMRIYTKDQLYEKIWGYPMGADENAINIHISNIRRKIKAHTEREYIHTVWGVGVKLQ